MVLLNTGALPWASCSAIVPLTGSINCYSGCVQYGVLTPKHSSCPGEPMSSSYSLPLSLMLLKYECFRFVILVSIELIGVSSKEG